jgi:hypothetical protein
VGMYTKLFYDAALSPDCDAIPVLQFMMQRNLMKDPGFKPPDHPLFKTDRWSFMFHCGSEYFNKDTDSFLVYDIFNDKFNLHLDFNIKNYNNEIYHFIDWIDPYVIASPGDYLGYFQYEEDDGPTLIRKE